MVTLSLLEGTPFGVQFVLVDQSVDVVPFQVKLPAKACTLIAKTKINKTKSRLEVEIIFFMVRKGFSD